MNTPFTIRCGRAGDLDALVALERRSFAGDRLSRRQLSHHLYSDKAIMLVATHAEDVLGDALVLLRRNSLIARLYSLVIAAEARGRGLGQALLGASERAAQERGRTEMRLEVRDDNAAAIHLYETAGYRLRDLRPGYYEDGATARRYRKPLA